MRYETDVNGYITCVVWGCYTPGSTEYNGEIPAGYSTLVEWADNACINAYYIDKNGNLVLDAEREAELKIIYEQQAADYAPVVHKDLYAQQEILESQYLKATAIGKILELTEAKNMATTVKLTNVSPGVIDIIAHGKNMLRDNMEDKTISGLTFSTFKDSGRKRVEISGTATEDVEYTVSGNGVDIIPVFALLKDTDYYLSMSDLECEFRCFNGETYEQVYSGTGGVINLPENKKVTHVVVKIPAGTTILKNITPELYYGSEAAEYALPGKEVRITRIDLTGHEITDTVNASLTISGGLVILQADGEDRIVAAGNVNLLNGYNMVYTSQGNDVEIEYCKNILDVSSLEFLQGKNTTSGRFMILEDGSIKAVNGYFSGELNSEAGNIGGFALDETSLTANLDWELGFSIATEEEFNYHLDRMQKIIVEIVTPTDEELEMYDINGDGRISSVDTLMLRRLYNGTYDTKGVFTIDSLDGKRTLKFHNSLGGASTTIGVNGIYSQGINASYLSALSLEASQIETTSLRVNNAPMGDFVVEQGTSGNWVYRKWNSGKAEVWGTATITGSSPVSLMGGYYSYGTTPNYPFAFINVENIIVNARLGSGIGFASGATTTTYGIIYCVGNQNSNIINYYCLVQGTWK